MSIRRPLSPAYGWDEVWLYREYADLAQKHLGAGRYFDVIIVSCMGFDVLVNVLPDRIRLHYFDSLTSAQQEVIEKIETQKKLTAGELLGRLRQAHILHQRLDRALEALNAMRNNVVHPLVRQEEVAPDGSVTRSLALKPGTLVPHSATKEDADRYFRHFCHVIDMSGGESPRKDEKICRVHTLAKSLERRRKRLRWQGTET